jgi:hypothetical protein
MTSQNGHGSPVAIRKLSDRGEEPADESKTTLILAVVLFCGGLPALEKICVDILPFLIHVM